jgi:hypothetical protein
MVRDTVTGGGVAPVTESALDERQDVGVEVGDVEGAPRSHSGRSLIPNSYRFIILVTSSVVQSPFAIYRKLMSAAR